MNGQVGKQGDERLWRSDQGDGTFVNPVLFADYSDPDVIRVGDTYYLTASSFNYTPGLPILVSRDLVNWRLVNYALRNLPEERFRIPRHSEGVWAPALRYHDGMFYIYYGMPDEGYDMVRTRDPLGEWEAPVRVLEGKGLIDPCPFWDADGRAYLVHGYAKSRIGFKSHLGIFEMNPEGTRAISEDHILYCGLETQPTIEGPKIYFRNGYYYIFAPAGGVRTGWQTVLRARNIHGPFEERIVLRQGGSPVNGPHQGALVDVPESGAKCFPGGGSEDIPGRQYFVHFQDRGLYGRIVHVQPVRWEEDWPVIGRAGETGCGEPVLRMEKPVEMEDAPVYLGASDDFSGTALGLQWQWLGNHDDSFYTLTGDALRLYAINPAREERAPLWREANVLTQKLVCPYFEAEVCMDASRLADGDTAGMVVMGGLYFYLGVRREGEVLRVIAGRAREVGTVLGKSVMEDEITSLAELSGAEICFRVRMQNAEPGAALPGTGRAEFAMEYAAGGMPYVRTETDFVPSDHTWVGAKLGIFAHSDRADVPREGVGSADFRSFAVTAMEEGIG